MPTVTNSRSLDQVEVNVQAVTEEQRVAVLEVRLDVIGENARLSGVRCEHHDDVGPLGNLGRRTDRQSLLFSLLTRLRAFLEADAHIDARVTQAQRMGVALASVADHSNLAGPE